VLVLLKVDESELTMEYKAFLEEWAKQLNVSVEVLLGRIVVAAIDGYLYIEKIPDYQINDGFVR
jgi:hypothetical protein